jgi:hypothetical protein
MSMAQTLLVEPEVSTKSARAAGHAPAARSWAGPLSYAALAAILAVFLGVGIAGRDYGKHWDEAEMQTDPARDAVASGTLIPNSFSYPSLNLWINLAVALPETVEALREGVQQADLSTIVGPPATKSKVLSAFDSPEYLLRLRTVYLVLTSLVLVWVYLLVRVWGGSPWEAVLAAAFLGFSWEFSYHARWVAQDAVLTQFSTLCLLLTSVGLFRPGRRGWFRAAAVTVGLACGMKYTAGILLLPLLLAAGQARPPEASLRSVLKEMGLLVLIAGLTYLATTPGTLLRPVSFLKGFFWHWRHYHQLGHGGYTVRPGLDHGMRMAEYLGLTFFSHYPLIAGAVCGLALLGVAVLVKQRRGAAAVLLVFPVIYLVIFDRQKVMTIRNLLAVTPFLALLAARGVAALWGIARPLPARLALATVVIGAISANVGWMVYAAGTIEDRGSDRFRREAAAYIAAHPGQKFFVSPVVREWLGPRGLADLPNVTTTPEGSDVVLFSMHRESFEEAIDWPANDRTQLVTWFGPCEVNLDYYPSWIGDDRIIAMTTARARAIKIAVIEGRTYQPKPNRLPWQR